MPVKNTHEVLIVISRKKDQQSTDNSDDNYR